MTNEERKNEVIEAAKGIITSTNKVYSGYPGKLEWPEFHRLKQALEALESTDDR